MLGAGCLLAAASGAVAQPQSPPPVVGGEVAAPVEIAMGTVDGDVRRGPPRARLPAREPLELSVVNGAERSVWFVAPAFFRATEHIDSRGFTLDLVQGGFLVAPASTVRVLLRTPQPGQHPCSCYEPGQVPNPQSSGFLLVGPTAR